ncbi:MAG: hypothetical protein EPO07_04305 [Verrucomicrobia bacterium]|nr:MAG: hypothetical protein EPO07_04305 [Verrucomicrobiota bacterium]
MEKLSRRRLSSIGFTGQQLQLKTGGFHYAYGRLVEKVGKTPLSNTFVQTQVNPNSPSDVAPGKLSFILRGLAKQVLAVLKWVNSILGSLSKLVGQAEVLKEFKEVLENSLYTKQVVEGR